ncbi:acetyl-CoA carboxylase [[Clostridium] sordellii]|uniref:methylmalonyl-CoA decarboxylase subunit alpha n=1 Tax=Paraclostridium sordellii TaxID=1505 RepID=UPI0005E45095|nr:carboxyl transferase domain-containing protein [Paeniclostridium sordellii]CEQ11692.1 acetyl-CoA carboxylase [[Clostridium] sordellii] [Paeniclostridium sordellii]
MSQEKLNLLYEKRRKIEEGGGQKRIDKQHTSGKLTARERLNKLFDENTFVELDAFVKHRCTNFGMEKQDIPGEGVVTGYGKVDGRLVCAFAQDFTVLGGSLGEMHAKKIGKVMDMALKLGIPVIGLNDSGGARIQEAVDALAGYGEIFYKNTIASGVVPQISAIMGPCAGGAVYSPALTDFIYMVDQTSQMFITGPQVIKTVTGEEVTSEELGGASTHNTTSGVAHFIALNDEDCIVQIRKLLSFLPSNNSEKAPILDCEDDPNRKNEILNSIIPEASNKPYDMKEIIYEIVDNSDFYEVQPFFAQNIITGFARINGESIGIIANQPKAMGGSLDINASDKSSRFIRTCDAFNIPILSLVDVPGFLPGTSQEYGGIIRHGAKMLYAYSEATVPKITLITRKAYGGSYLAMCSKDLGADMVLAWPTAEVAVMGPSGAANIIFKNDIKNAKDPKEMRELKIKEYTDEFATPYKAAERGYIDDVIEPSLSRIRIADAIDTLASKREDRPPKKHGNIPL